jgi:hypothetical protein
MITAKPKQKTVKQLKNIFLSIDEIIQIVKSDT